MFARKFGLFNRKKRTVQVLTRSTFIHTFTHFMLHSYWEIQLNKLETIQSTLVILTCTCISIPRLWLTYNFIQSTFIPHRFIYGFIRLMLAGMNDLAQRAVRHFNDLGLLPDGSISYISYSGCSLSFLTNVLVQPILRLY